MRFDFHERVRGTPREIGRCGCNRLPCQRPKPLLVNSQRLACGGGDSIAVSLCARCDIDSSVWLREENNTPEEQLPCGVAREHRGSIRAVTRREFVKASTAIFALPQGTAAPPSRETLYNGIVLAHPWPPSRRELSDDPVTPPYLADPPAVIDIDVGRQLFVDDFLIEESSLHRVFHGATYHSASPVLTPVRDWEQRDPHAQATGVPPSPAAMVFSDGVFFDPADRVFKMWYMGGYQQHTGLVISTNGLEWERPIFDIVRGTNIVSLDRRDSSTVWLDHAANDRAGRYKMATYTLGDRALRLHISADGVHWRKLHVPGPSGDRSTCFYNPFRERWVFSLRGEDPSGLNRFRRYVDSRDFATTRWSRSDAVLWTGADSRDKLRPELDVPPELYNLDATPYESLLVGLFTIYRGERADREKPNDVSVGFSRDGFHWSRPSRDPFIAVSDRVGDWNWANVQSAGGGCVIVGDLLYFYVSGRQGRPGTSLPGVCSTGVATLRRDGFASLSDEWPSGVARQVTSRQSTLTTRPLRFSGRHLFVNAEVDGELRVEVLDVTGRVIEPFSAARCMPLTSGGTRQLVQWDKHASLSALVHEPVRLRFTLSRARLYAFWVSPSERGSSGGYVAAGGPAYSGPRDVL
jgi:hypothetical protein